MQMVNVGFPERTCYGFEIVDMPRRRHQSKIYTESNDPDFLGVFAELTSMQTLAIYPRLLVRV